MKRSSLTENKVGAGDASFLQAVMDNPFEGILAIQADKRVNYNTIRKIMYTAATAGFKVFRFLAKQQET